MKTGLHRSVPGHGICRHMTSESFLSLASANSSDNQACAAPTNWLFLADVFTVNWIHSTGHALSCITENTISDSDDMNRQGTVESIRGKVNCHVLSTRLVGKDTVFAPTRESQHRLLLGIWQGQSWHANEVRRSSALHAQLKHNILTSASASLHNILTSA